MSIIDTQLQDKQVQANVVSNDNSTKATASPKSQTIKLIDRLVADRKQWESSVYRTSNAALYSILQKCYSADLGMQGNKPDAVARRAGLNAFAAKHHYTFRDSTPVITKIVRCVFGNVKRSRISTYSLVLREAKKQNVAITSIPKFIEDQGGIEQIRLSKSPNYKSAKQKAAIAAPNATATVLAVAQSAQLSLLSDPAHANTQCVLVATQQTDGTFAINAVVRSQTALTAALVSYYSSSASTRNDAAAKQEAANDSNARSAAIQAIVNQQ